MPQLEAKTKHEDDEAAPCCKVVVVSLEGEEPEEESVHYVKEINSRVFDTEDEAREFYRHLVNELHEMCEGVR